MKNSAYQNNNLQRRYMEAIRELAKAWKVSSVASVAQKHKLAPSMHPALKTLRWTEAAGTGKRSGTKWIGPVPKSEEELLRMAHVLRCTCDDYIRDHTRKSQAKRRADVLKALDAPFSSSIPPTHAHWFKSVTEHAPEPPHQTAPSVYKHHVEPDFERMDRDVREMIAKELPRKSEVSILWGMFKWSRA